MKRLSVTGAVAVIALTLALPVLPQEKELTREGQEQFLRTARVTKSQTLSEGTTGALKVTLTDGSFTHLGQFQPIDDYKQIFTSALGTELNFKDTYKANIAAYRLDKILGLGMIPPSVERTYRGSTGAMTWWLDDVMMTEKERFLSKKEPPNAEDWNNQMHIVRVFDQLIYNMDRNLGNLVITGGWVIHMIDHTRAFRVHKKVKERKNLVKCDRQIFEALQGLEPGTLTKELSPYLTRSEIGAILARRDQIVKIFESKASELGEEAVFYDYLSKK